MIKNFSFENYIIQCCRAREWNLRKFLKSKLNSAGFSIVEDDYASFRGGKYKLIHNMLAIRGEKPKVCLVAHTDVCRDHAADDSAPPNVNPAFKEVLVGGAIKQIIQDKNCDVQVGGDDRLGVAINSWLALNTGYDVGLLLTTDEEVGAVSASYAHFPELLDFELLLQVDRGNRSNQLVTSISGIKLCSTQTARRLLRIAERAGNPRYEVDGLLTDVLAIKTNRMCRNAVNMTCGYHNSIGAQQDEFIDIQEARDTMKYVSNIVQHYDLEDTSEALECIDEDHISDDEYWDNMVFAKAENEKRIYFEDDNDDIFSEQQYALDKEINEEERYERYWRNR